MYISVNCSNGGYWVSMGGMAECRQAPVSNSENRRDYINQVIQCCCLVISNLVFYEILVINQCLHLFTLKFFNFLQSDRTRSSGYSSWFSMSSEQERVISGWSVWLLEPLCQYKNLVTACQVASYGELHSKTSSFIC